MRSLSLAALGLVLAIPALASPLDATRFTPHIGATVPMQASWSDALDQVAPLRSWLDGKPALLTVSDFDCPHLCRPHLEQLAHALRSVSWRPGQDYRILICGLDPRDGLRAARDLAGRWQVDAGTTAGLHVLRAPASTVAKLLPVLGITAIFDPRQNAFAHPAVTAVLGPDGRIVSYLPGFSTTPPAIRLALFTAASGRLGEPFEQIVLRCYHLDPQTGQYSLAAWRIVQLVALLALVGLIVTVHFLGRRR